MCAMDRQQLIESCRHWAAEMHRTASVFEDEGIASPEAVRIIDGNRAIADTLAQAAKRIANLEAALAEARSCLADMHEDEVCRFTNPESEGCMACWAFEKIAEAEERHG